MFYKEEKKVSRLLTVFADVAISIGCIGLFGLITVISLQSSKEIGIWKTLGAPVFSVGILLSKEFNAMVALATLIASPIAWCIISEWLIGFTNHIRLLDNSWTFALAGATALVLATVTMSLQAIRRQDEPGG